MSTWAHKCCCRAVPSIPSASIEYEAFNICIVKTAWSAIPIHSNPCWYDVGRLRIIITKRVIVPILQQIIGFSNSDQTESSYYSVFLKKPKCSTRCALWIKTQSAAPVSFDRTLRGFNRYISSPEKTLGRTREDCPMPPKRLYFGGQKPNIRNFSIKDFKIQIFGGK